MAEKYSAIMELGRHSDVTLLRDTDSGNFVVRRIVDRQQAAIYQELQKIGSSHIPAIYSISTGESGKVEILEDYIDGQTLEEILQEKGAVPEQVAVIYSIQLCDALIALHHAGLIHRDIKPSNIIISSDGRLYLIDFDIARKRKEDKNSDTEFLGTQGYAAPEQFGFRQTNEQTDVYAVGILLNKLLTGKMPQESLARGRLTGIIRRCIEMDAKRRYQNAKALKRALRPYLPMGHPQALNFLRQIPGFRSFTPWKMVVAGIVYAFLLLCILMSIPEALEVGARYSVELVTSWLYYVFLWFFLFDSFRIRSCIPWLEKSRGRWSYPFKCVLLAVAVLVGVSVGEQWLMRIPDAVENFIEMYVGSIPKLAS